MRNLDTEIKGFKVCGRKTRADAGKKRGKYSVKGNKTKMVKISKEAKVLQEGVKAKYENIDFITVFGKKMKKVIVNNVVRFVEV